MTLSSLEDANRTQTLLSRITQQWLIDSQNSGYENSAYENSELKRELSICGIRDAPQRKKRKLAVYQGTSKLRELKHPKLPKQNLK
jgi:hypothetical protein